MAQIGVGIEVALQVQALQKSIVGAFQKLIEDVEVSLVGVLMNDSRLLEQVVQDVPAIRNSLPAIKTAQSYQRYRDVR